MTRGVFFAVGTSGRCDVQALHLAAVPSLFEGDALSLFDVFTPSLNRPDISQAGDNRSWSGTGPIG
jgi:hypothetical protein